MVKPSQAVILAGGRGTRLLHLTENLPKPMINIGGQPFLSHLFKMLKGNGITEVLLLLGYKHEKIVEFYGDGAESGLNIQYSIGDLDWKTGLRLSNAKSNLKETFLLLYCDNFWPLNLDSLSNFHQSHGKKASVTVFSNKDGTTKNNIFVDSSGIVRKYDPGRTSKNLNGVEIGFFIMNRDLVSSMPEGNYPFEQYFFPSLIEYGELGGYLTEHKYYSIGDIARVNQTEKYLQERKVIFLDRDGVINRRAPKAKYISNWSEFDFLDNSIEALKKLSKNKFEIYIITNQAGIARGMMTIESLNNIHDNLVSELSKYGISIHGIFFCPHGWNEGCSCRKPEPGMLFQAAFENDINLTQSILVGDDERDILAGNRAGCAKCFLVDKRNSLLDVVDKIVGVPNAKF